MTADPEFHSENVRGPGVFNLSEDSKTDREVDLVIYEAGVRKVIGTAKVTDIQSDGSMTVDGVVTNADYKHLLRMPPLYSRPEEDVGTGELTGIILPPK